MDAISITPIPAFNDNYLWLLERAGKAAIVDPGDAAPVLRELAARKAALEAILVTHHHGDHIGGIARLLREYPGVPVYGPAAEAGAIGTLTTPLREGDRVSLPGVGVDFTVWEVPGHTLGHIAYVAEGFVLCGDTLFSAGCGRLFEGTAEQLHQSLSRLAGLPASTVVYCTHEYTLANLAFARAVEPGRAEVADEIQRVEALRKRGVPSLPTTIGREKKINPFLRVNEKSVSTAVAKQVGDALPSEIKVFAALRRWKDGFRAPHS